MDSMQLAAANLAASFCAGNTVSVKDIPDIVQASYQAIQDMAEPEAVDEVLEEAAEADALEEIARESEADDESGNDEETGSSEE